MAKSRHAQRRGGSLRRDVAVRTPKRTFMVFCEGEKTEPAYLKALKRDPASQALPVCVGTPTWIVRRSDGVMQTSKRSNGFGRRTSTIELAVL